MSAPLDLLAGVVAQEAAALASPPPSTSVPVSAVGRPSARGVRKPRRTSKAALEENAADDPAADSKRALRAERNRQSAAASRDRKKQHLRELENRVRYLSDMTTALQYKAHVDSKEWRDKQTAYEAENGRLAARLASTLADNESLRAQLNELRATVERARNKTETVGEKASATNNKVENAIARPIKCETATTAAVVAAEGAPKLQQATAP